MSNNPNFMPFLAYSASAGSGKTFALSARYISLLFMGESPSAILAATFTNKAAAEMRQRVVDSLRTLGEDEAFLGAIMEQTGYSQEAIFENKQKVLDKFLASTSHIITLDALFSSILRSASLSIGIEPDFVTKQQESKEKELYFLDEVQTNGMLDTLVNLSIDVEDRRFGKLFDMMQNFYKIDPLLPNITSNVTQIHSIEEQIERLRESMHKILIHAGASKTAINNFAPIDTKGLSSKSVFSQSTLYDHRNYKKYIQNNPQIEDLFLELKLLIFQWMQARESLVLSNIFKIYDYYKNANILEAKSSNVISFDDLTYLTHRLLHESISREFLYFKLDTKFKHILLDEFQDTSTLQFLLLKPLIDEIFSGLGQNDFKSFFYVGDTKQSLYRFRGGVEQLFERVAQIYDIKTLHMSTNYRSAKYLVEQVNRWFEPVMNGYVPQLSKKGAEDGYLEVVECEDEIIDESIKQIEKLLNLGIDVNDITILVATNKDGQAVQEACQAVGIDTLLKTSSSLKAIPKIASIVAMIEYLYSGAMINAKPMLLETQASLEELDISWFSPTATPVSVIDKLIKEFGYFDSDLNLLRLLEFASNFTDIPEFIEEFYLSDISVASASANGVKIMTVHGSKGLEFDYVILLDKFTKPNSDKSLLIYGYSEDLELEQILYRMKGRENFDPSYADALSAQKELSAKDKLNMLYVAMTRAVKGMVVVKKEKESQFDQLGLVPMKIGAISHTSTNNESPASTSKEVVTISHYGTQERQETQETQDMDYDAILFGTALHYALDMLASFDMQSLEESMVSLSNKYGQQLSKQSIEQIRLRISHLIQNQQFQELLQGAIVSKEQSLSFEGQIKQIDLMLEYDTHVLIIDYKSSKKFSAKHEAQVSYYQKAIANIMSKETRGAILYLLSDKIEIQSLN